LSLLPSTERERERERERESFREGFPLFFNLLLKTESATCVGKKNKENLRESLRKKECSFFFCFSVINPLLLLIMGRTEGEGILFLLPKKGKAARK